MEVQIANEKHQIDIELPCSLSELCLHFLRERIDFYLLCGNVYSENDFENVLNYDSVITGDDLIIFQNYLQDSVEGEVQNKYNIEYNIESGEDNIGKWYYIFETKINYFENNLISKDNYWANEFSKSQKYIPIEYQKIIEEELGKIYIQIRFYPQNLLFSIVVLGSDWKKCWEKCSHTSICRSISEAHEVLNGIIEEIITILLGQNITIAATNNQKINVWAKNRGLYNFNEKQMQPKFDLNFSQIFLISKENKNISFNIWNPQINKMEKSTLKFLAFSNMFKGSPDFSIKASIFGKKIQIYDLLRLGSEDLQNFSFEQRLNFLNMLVDNWEKNNCEVVVESFQSIG